MTKTKHIITSIFLTITLFLLTTPKSAIAASNFEISIEKTFTVSEDGQSLHISEKREITNQTDIYYIPATSEEIFTIQLPKDSTQEYIESVRSSVKLHNENSTLIDFTATEGDIIKITASYPKEIYPGTGQTFILEYSVSHLIDNPGKLVNIFLPGLSEDISDWNVEEDIDTHTKYSYILKVPESLGSVNFTSPIPSNIKEDNDYFVYTFDTSSQLRGKTIWQQLGTEQIYKFRIQQPTLKSDDLTPSQLNFLSKNIYQIALPRDYDETNQTVYFTNVTPTPIEIAIDTDGNALATFLIDATKDTNITIEGYIVVDILNRPETSNPSIYSDISIDDYSNLSGMERFLQPSEFWESDSKEIKEKASELMSDKLNILDILETDYNFVIDLIDYDNFKYGNLNQRNGALATLNGSNSVCMEYSDLLIALTRAQGIPSRAAYGYGYSSITRSMTNFNDGSDSPADTHQWVQLWIPDQGWLTIDPTWGETGRRFIGPDLDHALWYVASEHPEVPASLEVYTSNSNITLEPSEVTIDAVKTLPELSTMQTLDELIQTSNTEMSSWDKLAKIVQTSYAGRLLVILIPICSTLFISLMLISVIAKSIRKARDLRK